MLHFFDGFQVSHEMQRIKIIPYEKMKPFLEPSLLQKIRDNSVSPMHPTVRSTLNGRDTLFQAAESNNQYFSAFPDIVENAMKEVGSITGRNYQLFEYHGICYRYLMT